MKKEFEIKTIVAIVVAVVLLAVGFGSGMAYGKRGSQQGYGARSGQMMNGRMGARTGQDTGMAAGEVMNKEAGSFVVKMQNGSTKIVLTTASTTVSKMTEGSVSDFSNGTAVMVIGQNNTDGSITAKQVQIRPEGAAGDFRMMRGR
jgi:uncharacterized spore protein YtfJ